jgi:histone H1/5
MNTTSAVCDSVTRAEYEALQARVAELEAGLGGLGAPKAKAKAVKAPKAVKAVLNLSSDNMGRMNAADINDDLCQARVCSDADKIQGYKPAVFKESQCQRGKKVGDLCTICNKAFEKAEAQGDEYKCYPGKWFGLITEDPLPSCHMLGTAWAEKKVSKVDADADGSASESDASEQMETKPKEKETKEASKAEKAAAKEAEKVAKAAAAAVKKATAEAAKAEKAAAKAAKAESKESKAKEPKEAKAKEPKAKEPKETKAKEAKEPKAKAEKAEKGTKKGKKEEKPDVMPAKADDEEVKEAYDMICWDDEVMAKKSNGDCYTVDELTQTIPQTYVGHMNEDGMLDKSVPEQTAAESDSE